MNSQLRQEDEVSELDRTISRLIWALSIGCFIATVGYAVQAHWLDTPPTPWLGSIGAALASAAMVHGWMASRTARNAKARAGRSGGAS